MTERIVNPDGSVTVRVSYGDGSCVENVVPAPVKKRRYHYYDGKTLRKHYRKGLFFVVFRGKEWTQTYTLAEMRSWAREAGGARLKRFLADPSKSIKAARQ